MVDKIRRKYIPDPNFEPKRSEGQPGSDGALQVVAMEAYDRVAKVVAPKNAP